MICGITVFDLDGTLLRGETVCEVLAKPLGRTEEMKHFEGQTTQRDMERSRTQMAEWFTGHNMAELRSHLRGARWAPGAHEAVHRLHSANVRVAIASVTWRFAVGWFAEQLNVQDFLGTDISEAGEIIHVWGHTKKSWLRQLAADHRVPPDRIAAVGDSSGDVEMLSAAALRFYVGSGSPPDLDALIHLPSSDLRVVADHILHEWSVPQE